MRLSAQRAAQVSPVRHDVQQQQYPLLPQVLLHFPQIHPLRLRHRLLGECHRCCRTGRPGAGCVSSGLERVEEADVRVLFSPVKATRGN